MHPSTYDQHCAVEQTDERDRHALRPAIWLITAALIAMLFSAWEQVSQQSTDSYNFLGQPHNTRSNAPLPSYARVADPTLGKQPAITDE